MQNQASWNIARVEYKENDSSYFVDFPSSKRKWKENYTAEIHAWFQSRIQNNFMVKTT